MRNERSGIFTSSDDQNTTTWIREIVFYVVVERITLTPQYKIKSTK